MKHKKALITGLIIVAIVLFVILAGTGFVFWKINSYTAGNWLVDSSIKDYISRSDPDLDYEIISRKIYETESDTAGRVLIVWEYKVKCDDETYTAYNVSDQSSEREPLYFNVADYAQIYFDKDDVVPDIIKSAEDHQ